MDKDEIIAEAQRLGTFPISIVPDQDCCTLFTPRHPATRARLDDVEHAESEIPIDEMVQQAVDAAATEYFVFPEAGVASERSE
jgi:thiamine biosynthesis protein ThiI